MVRNFFQKYTSKHQRRCPIQGAARMAREPTVLTQIAEGTRPTFISLFNSTSEHVSTLRGPSTTYTLEVLCSLTEAAK